VGSRGGGAATGSVSILGLGGLASGCRRCRVRLRWTRCFVCVPHARVLPAVPQAPGADHRRHPHKGRRWAPGRPSACRLACVLRPRGGAALAPPRTRAAEHNQPPCSRCLRCPPCRRVRVRGHHLGNIRGQVRAPTVLRAVRYECTALRCLLHCSQASVACRQRPTGCTAAVVGHQRAAPRPTPASAPLPRCHPAAGVRGMG
jgi:hypothetical protein